jgi:hypothetical protein
MARQKCLFGFVTAILLVIVSYPAVTVRAQGRRVIHVSGVTELYAAVNDPENAGARIVIAPGTYFLDPTQPNGGRLELQQDMEVIGQHGDSTAVVIDASNLPPQSFQVDFGNTGPVRMGRGSNALEWVTVQNASVPAPAAVETDLLGAGATIVRVAHIIAQGNQGGIDFRNPGAGTTFDGRVLHGIAEDNVLRDNTSGNALGIRVINTGGVTGATAWVTLRSNRSYRNQRGLFAANNNSSGNVILIDSRGDQFTNNVAGCVLHAGLGFAGRADSNLLVFEAEGDVIADNDGPSDQPPPPGGIDAFGASTTVESDRTSGNLLRIALAGTRFSGNHADSDINAFGARGTGGVLPGTDNHVEILLKGISRHAALSAVDSDPPDPNGTNTVMVRKAY